MKERNIFFTILLVLVSMLSITTPTFASGGATLLYEETDLGGGIWQYDYTFYNTSSAGESLYNVYFYFPMLVTITGSPLPAGWDGTVWTGTNVTDWLDTFSYEPVYDIAAGTYRSGFSFMINYRAGNINYDAYYGDFSVVSGTTAIIPEPISYILFLSGGIVLGGKCHRKKRR